MGEGDKETRVLVVATRESVRKNLAFKFHSLHFEVVEAQSAEDAFEQLRSGVRFDAVVYYNEADVGVSSIVGLLRKLRTVSYQEPILFVLRSGTDYIDGEQVTELAAFHVTMYPRSARISELAEAVVVSLHDRATV